MKEEEKNQIKKRIAEMLEMQGFKAMARDIAGEEDVDRIKRYVRVVIKNSPDAIRMRIANQFRMLKLY